MDLNEWENFSESWKDKIKSEEGTKIQIITPFLKSLNWDIGTIPNKKYYIKPEHKVQDGSSKKRVDYAFICDGHPKVYVEAKNINNKLRQKHQNQLFSYMRNDGVPFGLLTNGIEIKLYISDFRSNRPEQHLIGHLKNDYEYIEFIDVISENNLLSGKSDEIRKDIIDLKHNKNKDRKNFKEKLKKYKITHTPDKMLSTIFDDYTESKSKSIETFSSSIKADPETLCGFYTGTKESIEKLFVNELTWGAVREPNKNIKYIAIYSKEESAITHIGKISDYIPVSEYPNAKKLPSYSDDKIVYQLSEVYKLDDKIVHSSKGSFGYQFKYTKIKDLRKADTLSEI